MATGQPALAPPPPPGPSSSRCCSSSSPPRRCSPRGSLRPGTSRTRPTQGPTACEPVVPFSAAGSRPSPASLHPDVHVTTRRLQGSTRRWRRIFTEIPEPAPVFLPRSTMNESMTE